MDDVALWDLASRAPDALRAEVVARLASDEPQRERVEALLAEPAPRREEGPRYEIVGLVGAGTQAEVYRARRTDLGRECALKVFRGALDPGFVERVRAEAALMARVLSPHVVPVFDAGDLGDGRHFIEMALCAEPDVDGGPGALTLGRSLRAHVVERGPLAPDEAARLLVPVCQAVAAAHRAGVVHSDVKPENVLVLPRSGHALLGDFGIAASLGARGGAARVGTIPYMAPEQFEARAPPTPASDVYGLGGTLLFALSGRPPHPERRADAGDAADGAPLAPPATVPPSLAEIVQRALARDAGARPSADELAVALEAFLDRRPTPWELRRPRRRAALFYRRHSVLVNLGFLGVVVAATLGLGLLRTVVAKSGLESRAAALNRQVRALGGDVTRLQGERGALEVELSRLRTEKEAIAGAEAREREQRLLAEGRSAEAARQLETAEAAARDAAALTARTRAELEEAQGRATREAGRGDRLERDLAASQEAARAAGETYRDSVDGLRKGYDAQLGAVQATLGQEREASAALARRVEQAERDRSQLQVERARSEARLEAAVAACRADRDDLRARLDAARGSGAAKGEAGARRAPPAAAPPDGAQKAAAKM